MEGYRKLEIAPFGFYFLCRLFFFREKTRPGMHLFPRQFYYTAMLPHRPVKICHRPSHWVQSDAFLQQGLERLQRHENTGAKMAFGSFRYGQNGWIKRPVIPACWETSTALATHGQWMYLRLLWALYKKFSHVLKRYTWSWKTPSEKHA